MKHIIDFSLSRRFKNKITLIMHSIIILILFTVAFGDIVIEYLFETSDEKVIVYYDSSLSEYFKYANEDDDFFNFKSGYEEDSINITKEDSWVIESKYSLDALTSIKLQSSINNNITNTWFNSLTDESIFTILDNISPEIIERTTSEMIVGRDKINISMFIVTGIYFAMLSFCTMIANEVVYEKTSRVLELVLTSVNTSTHFFSKMITSWLTVIIQLGSVLFEISLVLFVRNLYDEGSGILKLLSKYNLIEVDATTFRDFVVALEIDSNLIYILSLSLIYLLLGMIIIQMIMVCISSFINSIEESSLIQAPVYIVLLIIYYIALALNSPVKLSSGIGQTLSIVPVFSMLFMPMRLLLLKVSIYEVMLGIILSLATLVIMSYYGAKVYRVGILGGVNLRRKGKKKAITQ